MTSTACSNAMPKSWHARARRPATWPTRSRRRWRRCRRPRPAALQRPETAAESGAAGRRAGGRRAPPRRLASGACPRGGGSRRARARAWRCTGGRRSAARDGTRACRARPRAGLRADRPGAGLRRRGAGPAGNPRQPARQRLQMGAARGARQCCVSRGRGADEGCASSSKTMVPASKPVGATQCWRAARASTSRCPAADWVWPSCTSWSASMGEKSCSPMPRRAGCRWRSSCPAAEFGD